MPFVEVRGVEHLSNHSPFDQVATDKLLIVVERRGLVDFEAVFDDLQWLLLWVVLRHCSAAFLYFLESHVRLRRLVEVYIDSMVHVDDFAYVLDPKLSLSLCLRKELVGPVGCEDEELVLERGEGIARPDIKVRLLNSLNDRKVDKLCFLRQFVV